MAAEAEPGDGEMAETPGSPNHQELGLIGEGEQAQVKLLVNKEGRYVCMLCHKTFKTVSTWGQGPTGSPACAYPVKCLEPYLLPLPTGQHPQGPHGNTQQPQGPRVQALWGLLSDQGLSDPAPPTAHWYVKWGLELY